jgi:hypothetical protein
MPALPQDTNQVAIRQDHVGWARGHQSCPRLFVAVPRLVVVIALLAAFGAVGIVAPSRAVAYATIAPPPNYSTASGLPDGRVYEQVSPTDKDGNQAGASTNIDLSFATAHYAVAGADGNSVLFEGSGPMGDTASGYGLYFVAERSADGWSTSGVLPRAQEQVTAGTLDLQPEYVDPSSDLSHVMFRAYKGQFAPPPYSNCQEGGLYLSGPDPALAATWLGRPEIGDPVEDCSADVPVGGTPNFSTVYFASPGTLLPEDASRAPHASEEGSDHGQNIEAWGFYENREGVLKEAGVLPNGSLDPFGAVPAASGHARATAGNQVSADGSRAFFVSPDPASCGKGNNCAVDPPELYVRESGEKTALVSRDTLLPEVGGLPAGAPDGALGFPGSSFELDSKTLNTSYVYASSDGSQAFFESEDRLTAEAPEGPPDNTSPKMYDFDVNTGSLTYLPNVEGQIVTTDSDGSSFAFVNSNVSPAELELWSGPGAGRVTAITQLPGSGSVSPARMSSDGSVVVFQTSAPIAGFNDGGTHPDGNVDGHLPGTEQIFRYSVPTNTLGCVSCAPAGGTPISNAELTPLHAGEESGESLSRTAGLVEERGISSDGSRVFFDTADPLVPQDSNTGSIRVERVNGLEEKQEGRDVYEWENGTIYLISTGKSSQNSYFLDNSENGDDVFFATTEGLSAGDTDEAYDVYDARVPHSGDTLPAAAVPCEGAVCQGPPRVPSPLTTPASAAFSGLGNVAPTVSKPATTTEVKPKALTNAQKLSTALKACKKQRSNKRAKCDARARKKYAPKVKKSTRRDK